MTAFWRFAHRLFGHRVCWGKWTVSVDPGGADKIAVMARRCRCGIYAEGLDAEADHYEREGAAARRFVDEVLAGA